MATSTTKAPFKQPDFGFVRGDFQGLPKARQNAGKWLVQHLQQITKELEKFFLNPLTLIITDEYKLRANIVGPGLKIAVSLQGSGGEPRADIPNRYEFTGLMPFAYPNSMMGKVASSDRSCTFGSNRHAEDIAKDIWTRWYPYYNAWIGERLIAIEAHDESVAQLDVARNLLEATGIIQPFRTKNVGPKGLAACNTKVLLRKVGVVDGAQQKMVTAPECSVAVSCDTDMPNGIRAELHLKGLPVNIVADILNYLRTKGWAGTHADNSGSMSGYYGRGVNAILPR